MAPIQSICLGYERNTLFHIEEVNRNMMEETKSYMDDFLEFTGVSRKQEHALLLGISGCLTEIQANIKKIRNNRETQEETYQAVVQEEQLKFKEENTPNKSSTETIMQDV